MVSKSAPGGVTTVLDDACAMLRDATCPEQIFGDDTAAIKARYRFLARLLHPDRHTLNADDAMRAEEGFPRLQFWWQQAMRKVDTGAYGDRLPVTDAAPVILHHGAHIFTVGALLRQGPVANEYRCRMGSTAITGMEIDGLFKLARHERENDLIEREVATLRAFQQLDLSRFNPFLPELVDSFRYADARDDRKRATSAFAALPVLEPGDRWLSLAEVKERAPGGIDPKDAAWIYRRVLTALAYAHDAGTIHGAVLPEHVWVLPRAHGVVLTNWEYATARGGKLPARVPDYRAWYPPEIDARAAVDVGTDIYMTARLLRWLMTPVIPLPIDAFLRGCSLAVPALRPNDALKLRAEYDELIERLWGARRFRPFILPGR